MPSCLVNQCVSKTGKKGQNGQVILHSFPKDISRIKLWLQQTGQVFNNINALAQKILDENKQNRYRLCSCHFAPDSYIINVCGRTLKADAIPSIFPIVNEGECIIEENLKKDRVRKRKRRFDSYVPVFQTYEPETEPEPEAEAEPESEMEDIKPQDIQLVKIGFCDIGTQTDYTLTNSILVLKDLMIWTDRSLIQ
ncbi:THAP domain-containing protein 5-like [Hyla sarda]|uniref:THAP domain-containing protein 5-like n=1 Tax=Hyla sarda TaxID=327740 RepID=UPI0024C342D6|nr:THAP domain-containing protein 5-like [Hyla sarda]XP_056393695.1 THAP domain-containing protein 5-like [Hyla sarda]XP_056393696.1 THAP domain-containing protein 5-like [Hyla sarda]XP_056393697.1 THAP domain-containing protein 5-like [Hyla sarda]